MTDGRFTTLPKASAQYNGAP